MQLFSIGVRYEAVINVVRRYSQTAKLDVRGDEGGEPESLTQLVFRIEEHGAAAFAENVLHNRQRTSSRNGILKSEAVLRFSRVLIDHGVECLEDLQRADVQALERDVSKIPGQRSGISFKYFMMLAGADNLIKPDRMMLRFLSSALNRPVEVTECQDLIAGAVTILRARYPDITPRLLDYLIWESARAQGKRR